MCHPNKNIIFKELTKNVRSVEKAQRVLKLSINNNIRFDDTYSLEANTKLYALLFSVWVEALLQKTIFLDNAFDTNEIEQILKKKERNIESAFLKCLDIAFQKTKNSEAITDTQKQTITTLIANYAISPRRLRNKIAHGQWVTAVNKQFNKIDTGTTDKLTSTDCITIEKWFIIYKQITMLIELLVQSPQKGFKDQYSKYIEKINQTTIKMNSWSLEEKRRKIKQKISYFKK